MPGATGAKTTPAAPGSEVAPAAANQLPPDDTSDNSRRSSGLYGDVRSVGWRRTLVLLTAFLIGMSGAAAFHLGVYTGFIARDSRASLLEFLHLEFATRALPPNARWKLFLMRASFWIFGGIVAAVFQMADADSLVPIQAFVLGASWPSVVTQLMSGRSGPPPQPASRVPVDAPPSGVAPTTVTPATVPSELVN